MPATEIGFGVIGLGMGRARARAIQAAPGARLVAVSDLNEQRLTEAAGEFQCDTYTDYHKMLERDDVDVVLVMTPSGMHAEHGIDVARAGKHVVTTKPIDVKLEAIDRLTEVCKQENVVLAVDFDSRYIPDNHRIKQAIDAGRFGGLILGEVRIKWLRKQDYYDDGWHGTWLLDGGGALMNQSVHWIDLIQWLMGPVTSVVGRVGTFAHRMETEDLGMGLLEFGSGFFQQRHSIFGLGPCLLDKITEGLFLFVRFSLELFKTFRESSLLRISTFLSSGVQRFFLLQLLLGFGQQVVLLSASRFQVLQLLPEGVLFGLCFLLVRLQRGGLAFEFVFRSAHSGRSVLRLLLELLDAFR